VSDAPAVALNTATSHQANVGCDPGAKSALACPT
jgi:hypothetical protein